MSSAAASTISRFVRIASQKNVIQNNHIGIDLAGTSALDRAVSERGILLRQGAGSTLIGGFGSNEGNLVSGHNGHSIDLSSSADNVIAGNRVGTDAEGNAQVGNFRGLALRDSPRNLVAENLISGNLDGVYVVGTGSTELVLTGNKIGTNLAGTAAVPNTWYGVNIIDATGARVGGTSEAERNLISGNGTGVRLGGGSDHVVIGNYIGTDVSGTQAIGGTGHAVYVSGSRNAQIGSSADGAGNVLAAYRWGVQALSTSEGTRIQNNRIGTSADGLSAIGNSLGVSVRSPDVIVGVDGDQINDDREGNLISGNNVQAVEIYGETVANSVLAGNWIGTDVSGQQPLPNGRGIVVLNGPSLVRIGSDANGVSDALERNVISGNLDDGIQIENNSQITIAGNYIGTTADGLIASGTQKTVSKFATRSTTRSEVQKKLHET